MQRIITFCLIVCTWLASFSSAKAHGGNYIVSEARGRYYVVVALLPDPTTVGRADISIAILDNTTYKPIPVDSVTVQLTYDGQTFSYPAPPEGDPANANYGSHVLEFTESGIWQVDVTIKHGTETLDFKSDVKVVGQALKWLNIGAYMLPLFALFVLIGLATLRNRKLRAMAVETTGE